MNPTKQKYEGRLTKLFDTYMNETIQGREFKFMPKASDVPIIQRMGYSEEDDLFELVFAIIDKAKTTFMKVQNIVFFDDPDGRLVGIHILNFKKQNIRNLQVTLDTELDREIKKVNLELGRGEGNLSVKIVEKRKMRYLKDVISNNLKDISSIELGRSNI